MNKLYLYILLGIIILLTGFELILASVYHWHTTLSPWLSFIVMLIGVYFFEKAFDEKKKIKQ